MEGEEDRWGHRGRKGGDCQKCDDGTFPTCPGKNKLVIVYNIHHPLPGACADGSDATLDGDKSTEPCQDGSRPDKSVCLCQDGTELRKRGNRIKNVFNRIKDFFG